jgi:hypothetical protein
MARPSNEDSGVLNLQELAPRYTNSSLPRPPEPASPFWSSQMPVAAPPYAQSPPTWSSGQWSVPLQPIDPPHYTPRPLGMGMRRPRRWGLRFMMFFGLVGLGAFLGRDHLPRFPRSLSEASTTWDSLSASVRRATGSLTGKAPAPRVETPSTPAAHASRGPQIVPMPSDSPSAPPPAVEAKPRPRPQPVAEVAPAPEPVRPRVTAPPPPRVTAPPARPVRMAAVSRPPTSRKNSDPFESDAAAAAALAKPLKTPVATAAPRETPAPVERERAAPEPKAAPGSLDDLMNSSLKKPAGARSVSREIDRRLAGVNEVRDTEPARKKIDAEPAPPHALTRTEIQSVMHAVAAKVSTDCYQKFQQNGPADLKLAVNQSGSVTSVAVSGQFSGTPTGACVERVVKAASFPESAGLRFDYRISVR